MLGGSVFLRSERTVQFPFDYTKHAECNPNPNPDPDPNPDTDGHMTVSKEKDFPRSGRERRLSTEEVVRVAAARFIKLTDRCEPTLPLELLHPRLTSEEVRSVELACHLIAAAEKVCDQHFERAKSLLAQCFLLSSPDGPPIQRVVYYFSKALEERIGGETGFSEGTQEVETMTAQDVVTAKLTNHPVHLVSYNELPFTRIIQSISVGAILDNMADAKSIHIVDLSIKHGLQWRILMQKLATRHACPVTSLKITAVGASEEALSQIGKSLTSFADVLGLPFRFRTVTMRDLKHLRADMIDREEGESVGILSHLVLNTLIIQPEKLEKVMRVICSLRPCVMAVMDVEAKFNSLSFVTRFTEALFYYSAYFDCLHDIMDCDVSRMMIEGVFFSSGIKSIIATEGKERMIRGVGIEIWRQFFARFELKEIELKSTNEANCIVDQFGGDGSSMLERNGKSLLLGWKGTPLHFISAWKFQ